MDGWKYLLNTVLINPTYVVQGRQTKEMRIKGDLRPHTASRNLELLLVTASDAGTQINWNAAEGDCRNLVSILVRRRRRKRAGDNNNIFVGGEAGFRKV